VSDDERRNMERLRSAIATWNGGDWDAARDFYAPDLIVHSPLDDEPLHGPDGFKRIFDILYTAFPDMHFEIEHMAANGDIVMARWMITGTHTAPFVGFAPTGKRVAFESLNVLRMEDGCAKEIWATPNLFGLMRQIGAMPSGPPPKPIMLMIRFAKWRKARKDKRTEERR
jgi:steroid delta-isomerase-like uncharacterized protein